MGGCVVCDGGEFSLVLEVATVSNLFTLEDLKIEGERDDSLGGAGGQLQCPHSVGGGGLGTWLYKCEDWEMCDSGYVK